MHLVGLNYYLIDINAAQVSSFLISRISHLWFQGWECFFPVLWVELTGKISVNSV